MRLELRSRNVPLTRSLREHVERKLAFALGRFGHRVQRVRVLLDDVNGPKGGVDMHCRIETRLSPTGVLSIEERRADPFAAIARASERIGRRVARHVERVTDRRRMR